MAAKTTKKKTAAVKKSAVKKSVTTKTAKTKTSVKAKTSGKTTSAKGKKVTVLKGTAKPKKTVTAKKISKVTVKTKDTGNTNTIRPSKNGKAVKTYLNDKDLKFFKDLIMEQKNEILENARRLRESLIDTSGDYVGDNSTFSMHMAEQGTDEMEREKAYMFIQRDEKHLLYLERALERIAAKTYGLCISCGKHISKARLEAVPITSHCINCKQNLSH